MIAKALAQNGAAKVFISGRRADVLAEAAAALGPSVHPVVCDVSSPESLASAVSEVSSSAGFLNLLVCNAGVGGPQVPMPTAETSLEEWSSANLNHGFDSYVRTFEVNTAAVWYTTMAFLPLLGKGNESRNVTQTSQVVVTSSIAAFNKMSPGGYAYGQSKAAVNLLVKQLSVVLPQWNIRYHHSHPQTTFFTRMKLTAYVPTRANAICPGRKSSKI